MAKKTELKDVFKDFQKIQQQYRKDAEIMASLLTKVLSVDMSTTGFKVEFSKSGLGYNAALHIHDDGNVYMEGIIRSLDTKEKTRAEYQQAGATLMHILEDHYKIKNAQIYHSKYWDDGRFFRASMKI